MKYSKHAIEVACEAIDRAEGLVLTDALAAAVFDTLERAPWWEEIKPGYEFRIGEPYRVERADVNYEGVNTLSTLPAGGTARFFRDTRWTPLAPLAVGDVIETVEDLERLPEGAGFVDDDGDIWQVKRIGGAGLAGGTWEAFREVSFYAPFTVVYLPKTEATE